MAITRYENIDINNVTNSKNSIGEQTTTITKWFTTRALVQTPRNSLTITNGTRIYSDALELTLNYTANTKQIFEQQNLYSVTYKGVNWRIENVQETNDRMKVIFSCYRNDPTVPV
jgi:hypothetical protein